MDGKSVLLVLDPYGRSGAVSGLKGGADLEESLSRGFGERSAGRALPSVQAEVADAGDSHLGGDVGEPASADHPDQEAPTANQLDEGLAHREVERGVFRTGSQMREGAVEIEEQRDVGSLRQTIANMMPVAQQMIHRGTETDQKPAATPARARFSTPAAVRTEHSSPISAPAQR